MCLEIALKAWPLVTFCCFGRNKWTKKLWRSLESGVVKTTMCSTGRNSKQRGRSILTCFQQKGGYQWLPGTNGMGTSIGSILPVITLSAPPNLNAVDSYPQHKLDGLSLRYAYSLQQLYGFHACVAGQPVHHRWARCYPQVRAIRGV